MRSMVDAVRLHADGAWGFVVFALSPAFDPDSRAPRGDGRNVILVPGFMGPEMSMRPLAAFLNRMGYSASPWGRGINVGHRNPETAQRIFRWIGERADRLADQSGKPVSVVGQSLGGIYAREAAKLSKSVDRVVTLGTPGYLSPETADVGVNSLVTKMFSAATGSNASDQLSDPRYGSLSEDPSCSLYSIYSRYDGVVSADAAMIPSDRLSEKKRNVHVASPHCGMGAHPGCMLAVAECLADR